MHESMEFGGEAIKNCSRCGEQCSPGCIKGLQMQMHSLIDAS